MLVLVLLLFSLQSSEALEFLKRDLAEFSTVVQHDTTCSIVATATAVRNKLAVTSGSTFIIFHVFCDSLNSLDPTSYAFLWMDAKCMINQSNLPIPGGGFLWDHGKSEEEPL